MKIPPAPMMGDIISEMGVELADDFGGMLREGSAGETACFVGIFVPLDRIAVEGGVGSDKEVESAISEDAREVGDLGFVEIRGDL